MAKMTILAPKRFQANPLSLYLFGFPSIGPTGPPFFFWCSLGPDPIFIDIWSLPNMQIGLLSSGSGEWLQVRSR